MAEYTFERISKDNLKHLVTLYRNAFHVNVGIDYLEKKYNTSVFGVEYIGYVAMAENGIPAAYYGVFPIGCEYEGKRMICAQSGDTMTHSDHRGKGLFIELAGKTYALAKESGIAFVYGFPNNNSYPGFVNKLSWQHREDLNLFSIKIMTLPLAKLAKKVNAFRVFYDLYVRLILLFYKKETAGFPNSLTAEGENGIIHDRHFFDYKKYSNTSILKLRGKRAWVKIDGRLWIGDIEHVSEQGFREVISSLKTLAFLIGADQIHFHTHPGTDYNAFISNLGKVKSKNPIGFLDLDSGIDIASFKFQSGDFDTF
jgi:hypothetical protein